MVFLFLINSFIIFVFCNFVLIHSLYDQIMSTYSTSLIPVFCFYIQSTFIQHPFILNPALSFLITWISQIIPTIFYLLLSLLDILILTSLKQSGHKLLWHSFLIANHVQSTTSFLFLFKHPFSPFLSIKVYKFIHLL